jgi:hypothetical protein
VIERDGRGSGPIACTLLLVSIACQTTGLAFVVGVAVFVLLRDDRRRRAWIFVVPLVLYVAWWIWARQFHQDTVHLANVLLLPKYIASSFVAVAAAVSGFTVRSGYSPNAFQPPQSELSWAPAFGLVLAAALAYLVRRQGRIPRSLWVSAGALLAYWTLIGLVVGPARSPQEVRYMYPGAVLLLLVFVDAARGLPIPRRALAAVFAGVALAVAGNLASLREGAAFLRAYANLARAQLAMIELAGPNAVRGFNPAKQSPSVSPPFLNVSADRYLLGVARYGSFADTTDEVRQADGFTRAAADIVLASALGLRLERVSTRPSACRVLARAGPGQPAVVDVPSGGAVLRPDRPAQVAVRRFAPVYAQRLGGVAPGAAVALRIPSDRASDPWRMAVTTTGRVEVCSIADARRSP